PDRLTTPTKEHAALHHYSGLDPRSMLLAPEIDEPAMRLRPAAHARFRTDSALFGATVGADRALKARLRSVMRLRVGRAQRTDVGLAAQAIVRPPETMSV
ncbi:MAG: hypothetical protein ACRDTJ_09890, partial [Pseudonocardiaceae bacterium]